jgi:hypothetical protein
MSALIDLETCRAIRHALIIGLSSYGEIERLCNAHSIHAGIGGEAIPGELRPTHPTGSADTVADFADALASIHWVELQLCEADKIEGGAA